LITPNNDLVPALNVLFGNGDGTFQAPLTYSTYFGDSYFAAVGDFNEDGKTDFAVVSDIPQNLQVFLGGTIPKLSVSLSHGADFHPGEIGASYNIVIANHGPVPTGSFVLVVDTLPSEFKATAITGNGWNCTLGDLQCFRADTLAPGASFPPIQLTVNVASNAASPVVNTVTVSGGNAASVVANDSTVIVQQRRPR